MSSFNDTFFESTAGVRSGSEITLFSRDDIERLACGDAVRTAESDALEATLHYLKGFISSPHPYLGREGDVCPFTKKSLELDAMRFAVFRGDHTMEEIVDAMQALLPEFHRMHPTDGTVKNYRALLLVFPHMTEADYALIDCSQKMLKGEFTQEGLMVGEFHSRSQAEGVRNPQFRPLRSPYPMLAIRHMTASDLIFLDGSPVHFGGYVSTLSGKTVPPELQDRYEEALNRFGYADSQSPLHPKVFEVLQRAAMHYEVIAHAQLGEKIGSPQDFARVIGCPVESVAKSVCLKTKGTNKSVIAVVPSNARVNLEEVSSLVEASEMNVVSAKQASAFTGHELNGISPVGNVESIVVVDRALLNFKEIYIGTGYAGTELRLDSRDLVTLTDAKVGNIAGVGYEN